MPDNQDNERLRALYDHPESWTPEDLSLITFLRDQQREAVETMKKRYPENRKQLASLQGALDELEGALARRAELQG